MPRRSVRIAALGAIGAALMTSAPAPATADDVIRCVYPFWFGFAPVPVAIELGYFEEEGLATALFEDPGHSGSWRYAVYVPDAEADTWRSAMCHRLGNDCFGLTISD